MSLGPEEKPDEKMDPEHVKASNEHVHKTSETKHEDDEASVSEEKTAQVSSSSPSNEAYIDEKGALDNPPTKPELDASISVSPEPVTETKSPSVQTMGQPPGYDPNRIPASIFSTKAGNGADWSTTSNESLFSIHMGNNSFSRDYAILFGKSGELPKLDDWNGSQSNPYMMPGELPRLDEWNSSPPSKSNEIGILPPVHEESSEFSGKLSDVSPKFVSGQTTTENHAKENVVSGDQVQNVSPARKPPLAETNYSSMSNPASSPSASRLSDSSGHSGSSFAFPVLAGNDSGKNDLMKVAPEKPATPEKVEPGAAQAQPQVSQETTTVVSGTRWFPCFSWWPRFC